VAALGQERNCNALDLVVSHSALNFPEPELRPHPDVPTLPTAGPTRSDQRRADDRCIYQAV